MTYEEFVREKGLTIESTLAQIEDQESGARFYRYNVIVRRGNLTMNTSFGVGEAHIERHAKKTRHRPKGVPFGNDIAKSYEDFKKFGRNNHFAIAYLADAAKTYTPDLASVMQCLGMDSQSVDNVGGDFGAWAEEMGSGMKAGDAWKAFQACSKTGNELRQLLDARGYAHLLECEEGPEELDRTEWPAVVEIERATENEGERIRVTAGLHKLEGNEHPYFSVTAQIWGSHGTGYGMQHEVVRRIFPELEPVIALHLCDPDGVPMHAFANAKSHLGIGEYSKLNLDALARHLRISQEEAAALKTRGDGFPGDAWLQSYVDQQRPRWKAEAEAAVALIRRLAEEQS